MRYIIKIMSCITFHLKNSKYITAIGYKIQLKGLNMKNVSNSTFESTHLRTQKAFIVHIPSAGFDLCKKHLKFEFASYFWV